MEPALIALIGTAAGAVLFKLFEHVAGKENRREQEFTTNIRKEIRSDTLELRKKLTEADKELDELDEEIDRWRSKYYRVVAAVARHDLGEAKQIIKEES